MLRFAGVAYGALSVILGAIFLLAALRVYLIRQGEAAKKAAGQMFGFSIFYLFILYASLLAEHLIGLPMLPSLI
jgi:protoheme IX farnesyltransferase